MQWNELKSHLRHIGVKDLARIERAFEMGKNAHGEQKRKSGEPYFTHPIAVTHILADMGADADTLIAALLHDTVEDTDLTFKEIDKEFNGDVCALIDGVTKLEPEDVEHVSTLDDQIETLRKIFRLIEKDVRVMVIKLADRLHNMQTIEHLSAKRQKEMAKETLEVYVKIADRLSMHALRDELEGLCIAIVEPAEFSKLRKQQEQNENQSLDVIKTVKKHLTKHYPKMMEHVDLLYEQKSWGKLRLQQVTKKKTITGVANAIIACVCEDIDECYQLLGVLHQQYQREAMSLQDCINAPMVNGYQGIHTTVILENGVRIRCKIRTRQMQQYAREGIALLCFDKKASDAMSRLPWAEHIETLSQDNEKRSKEFWESLQNDILGEAIVVHGTDDQQALVPSTATVLDGVFYLYGKRALRLKEVLINGSPAQLHEALPHACSLTAKFAKHEHVEHSWLQYIETGVAAAHIRDYLSKLPRSKKRLLGRDLFSQKLMYEKGISLDEIRTAGMEKSAHTHLGYKSLDDVFIALAEGKLEVDSVFDLLYQKKTSQRAKKNMPVYQLEIHATEATVNTLLDIVRDANPDTVKVKNSTDNALITANIRLGKDERIALQKQLQIVSDEGNWSLEKKGYKRLIRTSLFLLVMLWGLDPVIANLLLQDMVSPLDLTFIRFVAFFIASGSFLAVYTLFSNHSYKPLSPFQPTLIASGVTLFLTAVFSYLTLSLLPPDQYILYIIGGLVVLTISEDITNNRPARFAIAALILLVAALVALSHANFSLWGTIFGFASASGFVQYSLHAGRYQRSVETIHARYPSFLFWLSTIGLLFTLLLYPVVSVQDLHITELGIVVAFVLTFSILPYGIFYECTRRIEGAKLEKTLPLVSFWTFGGTLLLNANLTTVAALPCIALAIILLRMRNTNNA